MTDTRVDHSAQPNQLHNLRGLRAALLAELERLPERLTPHSLRRTFASILVAIGNDPTYVMASSDTPTPA
jgi:integrase